MKTAPRTPPGRTGSRIQMQIISDATDVGAPIETLPSDNGRFHTVIIVEGVMSGDKRIWEENSIGWRDLPLPFTADDKNHEAHLEAVLIGQIDTVERRGNQIHGWGPYLIDPSPEAAYLIDLVKSGQLRGVSADMDDFEFEILFPVSDEQLAADETGDPDVIEEAMFAPLPTEEIDGQTFEVMVVDDPVMRVTGSRIMGACALTFPAFQEAFVEDLSEPTPAPVGAPVALAASGALTAAGVAALAHNGLTGAMVAAAGADVLDGHVTPVAGREAAPSRFTFPDIPPAEWFEVPETPGPMPLTILDSGQVFGHLAIWGECHIGLTGECVEPPPSASNYARFHVGEIPVAPVGRVAVGHLTFGSGGHADTALNAEATRAHYDRTCNTAADIVAVDGDYGIWVCGAARPGLTTAQIREVMSSPPSGDWRRWGRDLELVAALCVNVPGFNTPRDGAALVASAGGVRVRREDGLINTLIVSHPAPPLTASAHMGLDPVVAASLRARLAASIGRSPAARRAELAARVHGGS